LKITFGGGTTPVIPEGMTKYGEYLTKIINNDLLGTLPKIGWTMFILYRTGGGTSANLAQGSINSIINANTLFTCDVDVKTKSQVIKSLTVTNVSPSVGGKDAPSVEEIKFLTKYSIPAQNRCVTVKDYKSRILMIPPKFGCPFRLNAIEDNNKIVIPCLGLNSEGKLDRGLPETMRENIVEYLKEYKSLGDYVELTSGRIYNIGFGIDLFIDKNYNTSDVVKTVINKVKDYMSVSNRDMGEDIFIGDLEKEICLLDGVLSLIDLRVYALYGGSDYSSDVCPLPKAVELDKECKPIPGGTSFITENGANSFMVDLNQIDRLLYNDYNSMYEVKKETDIKVRCKVR
jgi:hypothetical protein